MSESGGKKKKEGKRSDVIHRIRFFSDQQDEGGQFPREADSASMDIFENKGFIFVEMELAGVDPSRIRVFVDDNILNIEGTKEEPAPYGPNVVFHCAERNFGPFRRVFQLGSAIDSDKIEANFKSGVLRLKMPKLLDRRKSSRQIKVRIDD